MGRFDDRVLPDPNTPSETPAVAVPVPAQSQSQSVLLWLTVLTHAFGQAFKDIPGLGPTAELLSDIAAATRSGRNIDGTLQAAADQWEKNGAPTFDELAAHRIAIQLAMTEADHEAAS